MDTQEAPLAVFQEPALPVLQVMRRHLGVAGDLIERFLIDAPYPVTPRQYAWRHSSCNAA